ncbi:MAG: MFS transporter, partial [Stackebrandtia sp.]
MTQAPAAPRPAGTLSRPYRAVTVGIIGLESLVAFEYLAVNVAMPTVARELDGVALYGLAFGAALAAAMACTVISGIWSDVSGPGRPLWTGLTLFTAGLLGAGAASNMTALIVGRAVQGLGGGLIVVALYVVVARAYPAELKPRVFAAVAAAWVIPTIVGPAIAGLITTHLGWRWVFFSAALLAPVGLLL